MTHPKRVEVAVGIVCENTIEPAGARVLISRRAAAGVLGGYWEFPGGKLEANESAEACVVRELREELGVEVCPTSVLDAIEHTYDHARVVLRPFICAHVGGEPRALEVEEWKWVTVDELADHRFPPANGPLLEQVRGVLGNRSG